MVFSSPVWANVCEIEVVKASGAQKSQELSAEDRQLLEEMLSYRDIVTSKGVLEIYAFAVAEALDLAPYRVFNRSTGRHELGRDSVHMLRMWVQEAKSSLDPSQGRLAAAVWRGLLQHELGAIETREKQMSRARELGLSDVRFQSYVETLQKVEANPSVEKAWLALMAVHSREIARLALEQFGQPIGERYYYDTVSAGDVTVNVDSKQYTKRTLWTAPLQKLWRRFQLRRLWKIRRGLLRSYRSDQVLKGLDQENVATFRQKLQESEKGRDVVETGAERVEISAIDTTLTTQGLDSYGHQLIQATAQLDRLFSALPRAADLEQKIFGQISQSLKQKPRSSWWQRWPSRQATLLEQLVEGHTHLTEVRGEVRQILESVDILEHKLAEHLIALSALSQDAGQSQRVRDSIVLKQSELQHLQFLVSEMKKDFEERLKFNHEVLEALLKAQVIVKSRESSRGQVVQAVEGVNRVQSGSERESQETLEVTPETL